MALWDNIFEKGNRGVIVPQQKTLNLNDYSLQSLLHEALFAYYGNGLPVWSGDDLEKYIKEGYVKNSDVYAIVSYILHAMLRVKIQIKKETDGGKLEKANESPLAGVFQQYVTSSFLQSVHGYKLITGNSYMYGMRPDSGANRGRIMELDVLPSHHTEIVFGDVLDPIKGYKLKTGDYTKEFTADQICHLKYWNPDVDQSMHFYGLSPIRAASMLVAQSNSSFESSATAMKHQGPPVLLSRDNDELTEAEAEALSDKLAQRYGGSVNRNLRIPITGGSVKAIQLGLSPADLKILESQKLTFEQMCRVYRFPVTIMDSKSATLDNMTVAERLLYTNCIIPELNAFVDKMQRWIVPAYGNEFRITLDTSEIEALQEDKAAMVEWLNKAWWIKASRKQEIMGEEPDTNMDFYAVPNTLKPVQTIEDMRQVQPQAAAQLSEEEAQKDYEEALNLYGYKGN